MISCSMRGVECDCPLSLCKAAPVTAPVFLPKKRDYFAVYAIAIVVVGSIAVAQLYTENKRLDGVDKVNQEIVKW
jgi:hypothetical protein